MGYALNFHAHFVCVYMCIYMSILWMSVLHQSEKSLDHS